MSTEEPTNDASDEVTVDDANAKEIIDENDVIDNDKEQTNEDNEDKTNDKENDDSNITKQGKKKKKKKSNKTSSTKPPSITKKSPYQWTSKEVSGWIESLGYSAEAKKFETSMITGSALFGLDRTKLQNDVKVYDVTARNGILKAIVELKKEIKFVQKTRVDLFLDGKTRKDKKKNDDDGKDKDVDDNMNNRKYFKIKRNNMPSDNTSNWDIQSILKLYDFRDKQGKEELDDNFALKNCVMNNDKKKSVFMFKLCNSESKQYVYLFTKNVDNWNIENVFEYIRNISNKQFILFADEMKVCFIFIYVSI